MNVLKKVDKYYYDPNIPIGTGSYGQVFKANTKNSEKNYAIKVIYKPHIIKDDFLSQALITQINIMKKLHSQYIVQFVEAIETKNNFYIIQQFCEGGDLNTYLTKNQNISKQMAIKIIGDILEGYIQLIKCGIIHRDLKPQNILINNNKFKIADFGLALNVHNFQNQKLNSYYGTNNYKSLQLLKGESHTTKSDIWSLGIIIYQLTHKGKLPYEAKSQNELIKKIQNDQLKINQNLDDQLKKLIKGMLKKSEQERFSFLQIYQNKVFGLRYSYFLNKNKELVNKAAYIITNLRKKIHQQNINILQLFDNHDYTKDSKLNRKQFYKFLLQIDRDIKKQQVYFIFNKFDQNGNNQIDKQEFMEWLKQNQININAKLAIKNYQKSSDEIKAQETIIKLKIAIQTSKNDLEKIFIIFDKDGNQQLDFKEFNKFLSLIIPGLSEQQTVTVFNKFDVNQDQKISLDQFKKILLKISGKPAIYDQSFKQRIKNIDKELSQIQKCKQNN